MKVIISSRITIILSQLSILYSISISISWKLWLHQGIVSCDAGVRLVLYGHTPCPRRPDELGATRKIAQAVDGIHTLWITIMRGTSDCSQCIKEQFESRLGVKKFMKIAKGMWWNWSNIISSSEARASLALPSLPWKNTLNKPSLKLY